MRRSIFTRTMSLVLGLAAVAAFAGNASAAYQITISFPDSPPTGSLDNNALSGFGGLSGAKDNNSATNAIDLVDKTTLGSFVYTYQLGRTLTFTTLSTLSNSPVANTLSYNYTISYSNNGLGTPIPQTVVISISRDDYTLPPAGLNGLVASAGGTFVSGSPGTMEVVQALQNGSSLYGIGTKSFDTGIVGNAGGQTWSQNFSENINTTSPYTLTSVITLKFTGDGTFSGNGTIGLTNVVPVPAGLVLALTGLPAFGLIARRRRAVQA